MLLVSSKYIKRPQKDYESSYISKLEKCGFQYFMVSLEKEVSEMIKTWWVLINLNLSKSYKNNLLNVQLM